MSDLGNKKIMAENIKKLMDSRGIDRKKLSDDLDISYTTVSDWINGKTYPRIDKIETMAEYFNVTKSQLVESANSEANESKDLNKMLDEAMTYSGKPLSDSDREIVKAFLEGKFGSK
ncbi:helix-turn-helix domain-containing protein [Vagococcus hydrophili]|nr:helix-turn-helix transcriptional regulator [Vagococcus hydrophili]